MDRVVQIAANYGSKTLPYVFEFTTTATAASARERALAVLDAWKEAGVVVIDEEWQTLHGCPRTGPVIVLPFFSSHYEIRIKEKESIT